MRYDIHYQHCLFFSIFFFAFRGGEETKRCEKYTIHMFDIILIEFTKQNKINGIEIPNEINPCMLFSSSSSYDIIKKGCVPPFFFFYLGDAWFIQEGQSKERKEGRRKVIAMICITYMYLDLDQIYIYICLCTQGAMRILRH